ncbi:MAG: 4Fe-4S binding protein [Omnitrophica WOR_2 bacterium]
MAVNRKHRTSVFQRPWVSLRKSVQYLALLVFFALFLASRQDGWQGDLVNLPMRLDPLAMLAHMLASRTFLAGSALALLTILLTLVFGRAWCSWLCPLGTVLDLFSLKHWRAALGVYDVKTDKGPAEGWRRVKYGLLIAILTAALFANLTLLIFDPLTILIRSLSTSFWPAVDRVFTAAETFLYQAPFLEMPLTLVDSWVRPLLLPSQPAFYRDAFLFGSVFFGVIALNLFAPRFWCRYLCPLGGLLGLVSKAALFKRRVGEECKACVLCTRGCPTGTINPEKGFASDPSECTM